jgi:hypothetical protein
MTSFKMATPLTIEQKTRILGWFLQTNSIVTVQRRFKNQYKCKEAPARNKVKTLVEQFSATGNLTVKKRGGSKPRVRTPDTVGTIRVSVASSPTRKSVRQIAAEYEVSPSTAWRILRTDLRMHPYKNHVFHYLKTVCREKRTRFAEEFGDHLQQDPEGQSVQQCSPNSAWTEDQGKLCTSHKRNAHPCCTELFITCSSGSRVPRGSYRACHPQRYHMWNPNPCLLLCHCFHINKFAIANTLLSWNWQ